MRRPNRLLLASLWFLGLACTREPEQAPPSAGDPAENNLHAPPAPLENEVAMMPSLLSRVTEPELPLVDPPSEWRAGWRLNGGNTWSYRYVQEMHLGGAMASGQRMQVEGVLKVSATSPESADVELMAGTARVFVDGAPPAEAQREQPLEPQRYAALIRQSDHRQEPEDALVWAMLSFPERPTPIGVPVSRAVTMPVQGAEGPMQTSGTATWTLLSFVRCADHLCAVYRHDLRIADLTVPAGMRGSYRAGARSLGFTLVDITEGALHLHRSATTMQVHAEVPAGVPIDGVPLEQREQLEMIQEHFHEVTRL
ncbi:MAG: hypothetical protein ACO3JL_12465 [Myxococcota bacterium]